MILNCYLLIYIITYNKGICQILTIYFDSVNIFSGASVAAVFTYKIKRNDVGIKIKSATAMSGNILFPKN